MPQRNGTYRAMLDGLLFRGYWRVLDAESRQLLRGEVLGACCRLRRERRRWIRLPRSDIPRIIGVS